MTPPDALLVALQFLTRLPTPLKHWPDDATVGRSLLWYPFTGLLLGLLLALAGCFLQGLALLPAAAILLALWVGLTGALHLDGLADSVDAWAGGGRERQRTLALMKDPTCGPMAITALVLVLLLKFSALTELLISGELLMLILPLTLGRLALLMLFLGTPYVRESGLGSTLARHCPQPAGWKVVCATLLLTLCFGLPGLLAILVMLTLFVALRHQMQTRIGGLTGDTAGATVELVETLVLLVLVC